MSTTAVPARSDALVVFGFTGHLANKKIIPAVKKEVAKFDPYISVAPAVAEEAVGR